MHAKICQIKILRGEGSEGISLVFRDSTSHESDVSIESVKQKKDLGVGGHRRRAFDGRSRLRRCTPVLGREFFYTSGKKRLRPQAHQGWEERAGRETCRVVVRERRPPMAY